MASGDDILKTANRLFSRVGSTVKSAAEQVGSTVKQGAKQVTGIGLGELRLALPTTRVTPGATISGTLKLTLPQPIDGKRLVVGLRANQRTVDYSRVGGVRTVQTGTAALYRFEHELAGLQRYESGDHAFELLVPPDALELRVSAGAGTIGDVARAVSSVVAPTSGPIEWQVWATLEIPWSRNLDHAVDIIVAK